MTDTTEQQAATSGEAEQKPGEGEHVLSAEEMAAPRASSTAPAPKHNRGELAKYAKLVSSADKGAYVS